MYIYIAATKHDLSLSIFPALYSHLPYQWKLICDITLQHFLDVSYIATIN